MEWGEVKCGEARRGGRAGRGEPGEAGWNAVERLGGMERGAVAASYFYFTRQA